MQEKTVTIYPIPKDQISTVLKANNIRINEYAKAYMNHSAFQTEEMRSQITLVLCSLQELGLKNGAVYADIFSRASELGLYPCQPSTGLFLRLSYLNQAQSRNSILSGTHHSPDSAVTVLSEFLEEDDNFPKGLYLRNVDGILWLRGYICDKAYKWSFEDVFAFEKIFSSYLISDRLYASEMSPVLTLL